MFLQTPTQVINTTTEKHVFSLWEILFSGGIIGNTIMICIFLLGILALYIFLERYFFIKRASKQTPNFLENIKDFVQAVVKAADSNLVGGFYNIAAKERVTLDQMIHGIVEVFSPEDNKSEITYDESKPDTLQSILDMSKTQKELGYQPQYSYIDMLKDFKKEMLEEPFSGLWNTGKYYESLYGDLIKE